MAALSLKLSLVSIVITNTLYNNEPRKSRRFKKRKCKRVDMKPQVEGSE